MQQLMSLEVLMPQAVGLVLGVLGLGLEEVEGAALARGALVELAVVGEAEAREEVRVGLTRLPGGLGAMADLDLEGAKRLVQSSHPPSCYSAP